MRRAFFGRQPLCGIGVVSVTEMISSPPICNPFTAVCLPAPSPFSSTRTDGTPFSTESSAQRCPHVCAANEVDLFAPLNLHAREVKEEEEEGGWQASFAKYIQYGQQRRRGHEGGSGPSDHARPQKPNRHLHRVSSPTKPLPQLANAARDRWLARVSCGVVQWWWCGTSESSLYAYCTLIPASSPRCNATYPTLPHDDQVMVLPSFVVTVILVLLYDACTYAR